MRRVCTFEDTNTIFMYMHKTILFKIKNYLKGIPAKVQILLCLGCRLLGGLVADQLSLLYSSVKLCRNITITTNMAETVRRV